MAVTMEPIIQVRNLKKSYRGRPAVQGISFHVEKGQVFALLGPNGAGKSTTANILCTCTPPEEGTVRIDGLLLGRQNVEIRKRIGVVFQDGVLDDLLTVEENLATRGRFYRLQGSALQGTALHKRIAQTAEMTGISALLSRRYGQLSGGQRRRCDIARALLHLPKILFLDEPTTGLDPEIRSAVWETVDRIQHQTGMTILLTTHYMEEAARADQVVILKDGKIAAAGPPSRLKERYSQDRLVLFSQKPDSLGAVLDAKGVRYRKRSDGLEIALSTTLDALPLLRLCGGSCSGFEVLRGSMDDAYLSVVERRASHA